MAKLLRCGIASEAPPRDMPLSDAEKARERNSGEILARKLCRFSSFNCQENRPQEISRKVGCKFTSHEKNLVDVSDIFCFSCSGEGKGESKAPGRGGGDDFSLKIPGGDPLSSAAQCVCSLCYACQGASVHSTSMFPGLSQQQQFPDAVGATHDAPVSARLKSLKTTSTIII